MDRRLIVSAGSQMGRDADEEGRLTKNLESWTWRRLAHPSPPPSTVKMPAAESSALHGAATAVVH